MRILFTEANTVCMNNDLSLDVFDELGETVRYNSITREELLDIIGGYDVLICNKLQIDREVMERGTRLKYIGLLATGYNNIDIACAKEHGITVCNAGSYSTDAVAQHTFAFLLAFYSKVREYDGFVRDGGWIRAESFSPLIFQTDELAGKTLGLIGYGSIGKAVARIASAFAMNVIVHTRTVKNDPSVRFVTLDRLLSESDAVSLHCPLTDENRQMFNASAFSRMRDGAYFINTARGGLVDEQALADALNTGKLAGAAVDVLTSEPMDKDCLLFGAANIIITPHSAWSPLTTRRRLVEIVKENLRQYSAGTPQNVIV